MAEVAGLALSAIAFTSLVTSCVDILEYFDHGRHWIYDLGLALTKVDLLKLRLGELENTIPQAFAPEATLDNSSNDATWVALRGLSGVYAALDRTNELCKRYSYARNPTPATAYHTSQSHLPRRRRNMRPVGEGRGNLSAWHRLGKKVCWAVQDKKRFDGLISDLDFLVSSIEKLVSSSQSNDESTALKTSLRPTLSNEGGCCLAANMSLAATSKRPNTVRAELSESGTDTSSTSTSSKNKHTKALIHDRTVTSMSTRRNSRRQNTTNSTKGEDRFYKNTLKDGAILLRGGYVDQKGGAAYVSTVCAEENQLDSSVMVVGSLTTKDLGQVLKYNLEVRQTQNKAG